MQTTLSTTTSQNSTEKEKVDEAALAATQQLLEFVELEARRFLDSTRSTMRALVVPSDIKFILVRTKANGLQRYTFGRARQLWFKPRGGKGYDLHTFYVKELCDPVGHAHQVTFDRSAGNEAAKLQTVSVKQLGGTGGFPNRYSAGPRCE